MPENNVKLFETTHWRIVLVKLFETTHWHIVLHSDQSYLGRAIAVAKSPRANLSEIASEEWEDLRTNVIRRYETAMRQAFGATMFNWSCLMNNAYQHDPPDPQVHWHVRPRYRTGPEVAGVRFDDPNFGHHYAHPTEHLVSGPVLQEIVQRFQSALDK